MTVTVELPLADGGGMQTRRLNSPGSFALPEQPIASRVAYAAAHVVADPLGDNAPGRPAVVDWDATLAFRRHLWSYGLGVAEAMDTAQRGMGLDWDATRELIRRSGEAARACGGTLSAGAGTDHAPDTLATVDDVAAAWEEQITVVEDTGAVVIIMASRQLAKVARGPDDYYKTYARLLSQVRGPVILHWLGPAFDPALSGYWGSDNLDAAVETVAQLVRDHADRVDGVKVSLLDPDYEVQLRRQTPEGVRVYTGDDFNYPQLILGDDDGFSDALLGVFAVIAPAASAALQALDREDVDAYHRHFSPTLPLARQLFAAPTQYYKTGIAFLAWLSGHQAGFTMVGGLQSGRSVPHLVEVFRLADDARLLPDPELAAARMRTFLRVTGVTS